MGIFNRNKIIDIGIPLPRVKWKRYGETTRQAVNVVAWSTLAFVIVAAFAIGLTAKALMYIDRKPGLPPKVITKVVHESALTAAQNAYIDQCRANTSDGYGTNGVPDIHGQIWTCTYPK